MRISNVCGCGNIINTTAARIKSGRGKFCSKECYNKNKFQCLVGLDMDIGPLKCGVYEIYCISNDTYYIGSSNNCRQRISKHISDLLSKKHCNKILQRTWDKYGKENFRFRLLIETTRSKLINEEERQINSYIKNGKSIMNLDLNPVDKSGANNGMFGRKHKENSIVKMSKSKSTLSAEEVAAIKAMLQSGIIKKSDIAFKFNVSESTIAEIDSKSRIYANDVLPPKVCVVTGSQGFISRYLVKELLEHGYFVFGIDNYSKYGRIEREHDNHPYFHLIEMDLSENLLPEVKNCDFIIANAALIGGIRLFHDKAFDIVDQNERILSNTFRTALKLHKEHQLKRIITLSSSMVFESTDLFPTPESHINDCKSPLSSYGRQKLMVEWWTDAAWKQHKLPYTIIRPFNCIGIGECDYKTGYSHVLPDLVWKCINGADPLPIMGSGQQRRCYTAGQDIARGIRIAMESDKALNEDFNISTPVETTVLELAEIVWNLLNPNKPFRYTNTEAMEFDVQRRIPDTSKARDLLGFEAQIPLEDSVKEVIAWMRPKVEVL